MERDDKAGAERQTWRPGHATDDLDAHAGDRGAEGYVQSLQRLHVQGTEQLEQQRTQDVPKRWLAVHVPDAFSRAGA